MSSVRYQGYPYVNPIVTDAPSLDPVTAAKWTDLPRRPAGSSLAGASGSAAGSSEQNPASSGVQVPIPPKVDLDENPVVYIELPQADGSDVCQSIETEEAEPEYVQNTILYDPFENRRIVPKEEACSESSASETNSLGSNSINSRPTRPNTLDLNPGPSTSQPQSSGSRPGLPSFMEKEAFVYGGQGADGYPISPIPMSEFPEPPPAYTEIAMTPQHNIPQSPVPSPSPQNATQTPQTPPPRTEVILPQTPGMPIGTMNGNRKYLTCHHCSARVHTIVVRENGHVTYIIAIVLFFVMMPLFFVIFFTDFLKHKNHYCPNCNKLIGYVLPLCGETVHYVP